MIEQQELDEVVTFVNANGLSEAVVSQMREKFPERHFTYCMDDDINVGRPVVEQPGYCIYLVDSREHCSKLTNDLDIASGFVLAEVIED